MNRWRILAIDDDPGTLDLITMAVEDTYEVITLSNPIEALDVAKLFQPDVIILDLMMPRVDGFHLLEIFRRDKVLRDVPVIILSAKKNKRDIQYGYQVGAVLYLTKPFQPTRLRRNIDFLFEHNPPVRHVKHLTYRQVLAQIKLLRCFTEGSVGFSAELVKMQGKNNSGSSSEQPSTPVTTKKDEKAEQRHREQEERKEKKLEKEHDTPWID